MLGTFPKDFFPSGNFPKVRWGQALRLGWARGSSAAARTGWWSSAAAKADLGICLENCTFGKLLLMKILLGSLPLGKNP